MIVGSYDNNDLLKFVIDFYMSNISKYNFLPYFNAVITNDIMYDYKKYKHDKLLSIEVAGLAILPENQNEKITILFSKNDLSLDIILHELTHAYDFMEFSKIYCNSKLHEVEKHHLFQTFVYWSEFHVKLYDIPYSYILFNSLKNNTNNVIYDFAKDIASIYYHKFTEKFINKIPYKICLRDIMWYLGEIVVCNLYDVNNEYNIDSNIISEYPFVTTLYDVLKNCLDIQAFCYQSEVLNSFFEEYYIHNQKK